MQRDHADCTKHSCCQFRTAPSIWYTANPKRTKEETNIFFNEQHRIIVECLTQFFKSSKVKE